jgi:hypothetical protein
MSTNSPLIPDAAHVVILGASNVTLAFPTLVAEVRRLFPGRIQLFAAHGHGRSYGKRNRAAFRVLPGLTQCGLWSAFRSLRDRTATAGCHVPVYALATDLGNDLLFGATPERIDEWLEECLAPLQAEKAVITIGRPPLHALRKVGRQRFLATRTFFFPKSPLTYERMLVDAPRLDQLIEARAAAIGARTLIPREDWYGFDPIHIRRPRRTAAWREILNTWFDAPPTTASVTVHGVRRRDWLLRPLERELFGRRQLQPQPAFTWADGSAIWLY